MKQHLNLMNKIFSLEKGQALKKRPRQFQEMPGISCILCLSNGCFYIGHGVNITGRLGDHKYALRRNKHLNKYP